MFETKKQVKERATSAEARAVTHFRKLNSIENIIKIGEKEKTPTVFIVDAIKKVLVSDYQSNN